MQSANQNFPECEVKTGMPGRDPLGPPQPHMFDDGTHRNVLLRTSVLPGSITGGFGRVKVPNRCGSHEGLQIKVTFSIVQAL
jgi:hypothetical protein